MILRRLLRPLYRRELEALDEEDRALKVTQQRQDDIQQRLRSLEAQVGVTQRRRRA